MLSIPVVGIPHNLRTIYPINKTEALSNRMNEVVLKALQLHCKELVEPCRNFVESARLLYKKDRCCCYGCLPVRFCHCWAPLGPITWGVTQIPTAPIPVIAIMSLGGFVITCTAFQLGCARSGYWHSAINYVQNRGAASERQNYEQAKETFHQGLGSELQIPQEIYRFPDFDFESLGKLLEHLSDCSFCCEAVAESLYSGSVAWHNILTKLTEGIKQGKRRASLSKDSGFTAYALYNNRARMTGIPPTSLDKVYAEVRTITDLPNVLSRLCVSYLGCVVEPVATGSFRRATHRYIAQLSETQLNEENSDYYGALYRGLLSDEQDLEEEEAKKRNEARTSLKAQDFETGLED